MADQTPVPLNARQIRSYMSELSRQGEIARLAETHLIEAMNADTHPAVPAFAALQSLLAAAAMSSKLLYPAAKGRAQRRAVQLRAALGINDVETLMSRKVRDSFEHFDERLDDFFRDPAANMVDGNIGPIDMIPMGPSDHYLRHFDPDTNVVSVLEHRVDVSQMLWDVMRVGTLAAQWMWDQHGYDPAQVPRPGLFAEEGELDLQASEPSLLADTDE